MTIDIAQLRAEKGNNPAIVRESEKKRGRTADLVSNVIELDEAWRSCQYQLEQTKKDQNALAKQIGQAKKSNPKEDVSELLEHSSSVKARIPDLNKKAAEFLESRDKMLRRIGNIVHESVPVSNDEKDNLVIRKWGSPRVMVCDGSPGHLPHHEILAKVDGVEYRKGADLAGHRGYYLKGPGAMMNSALIQYGQKFLRERGYVNVQPPQFMKREWMRKTAELKDFEDTLYCIQDVPSNSDKKEDATTRNLDEDLYLIATSEQPLCALHANESLELLPNKPLKYGGYSTCYRKEAGSHGKDMRGIFRVHQFDKVEQFVICRPEESWLMHETMTKVAEDFYVSLGLPYQIVSIVSGALNDAAARKYDLEAWFPSYSDYKELVSCSNCTDYQSRDLNIYLGTKTGDREHRSFVHLLNGTLTATQRTMCCILENYQTEDGVTIPEQLRPYLDDQTTIPFAK